MISAWLYEKYAKMWLNNHPGESYFGTCSEICDFKWLKEGLEAEVGQGDFDFADREVSVLPYNSPNMYCGE
jgi:hypothetical protein